MIRAALFDLDGTLVDSEFQTDLAIRQVMELCGHPNADLPPALTRGRTWSDIVLALISRYGLKGDPKLVEQQLIDNWSAAIDHICPVPGSPNALAEASKRLRVAIVSSSPRSVIDRFVSRLGAESHVPPDARFGAECVTRPKPDPQAFLMAARHLGVPADQCIVFEDSTAGLIAARAAGMKSMAILHCCAEPQECRNLATCSCRNYEKLPADFWTRLTTDPDSVLGTPWL